MMRLRLGGIEFVGDAGDATYTIEADGIRGLKLDGVDVRREVIDRPAAHGAFNTQGFLTGRRIRWSGDIETSNPDEQVHAITRLSGLLADGGMDRLVVDEGSSVRWLDVVRGGEPDITMITYGIAASYSFEAWAPDPRMYGDTREFAAGETAVHYGNFPATPRLLVGAGSGGYTVTGPDARQVVVGTAPAEAHYIDFVTGGLFTNAGIRQLGAITTYQPWKIGPGLPGAAASITGSRSLAQRVTDTFV